MSLFQQAGLGTCLRCPQVLELLQHFVLALNLGLNLGLYVSVLLVHPAPLLLGRLLLGRKVPLKLGLQGLHVHLQLNLLVLCRLQLVLQRLQLLYLRLLLCQLLLHLALSLLQLVGCAMGVSAQGVDCALGFDRVVQPNRPLPLAPLKLVQLLHDSPACLVASLLRPAADPDSFSFSSCFMAVGIGWGERARPICFCPAFPPGCTLSRPSRCRLCT